MLQLWQEASEEVTTEKARGRCYVGMSWFSGRELLMGISDVCAGVSTNCAPNAVLPLGSNAASMQVGVFGVCVCLCYASDNEYWAN